MDTIEEPILLRHESNGVVTLTLNRPKQFNALSHAMLGALQCELDAISADSSIRAVVLAANGKAFCAGHDLKEMRANTLPAIWQLPPITRSLPRRGFAWGSSVPRQPSQSAATSRAKRQWRFC